MNLSHILAVATGVIIAVFLTLFAITSLRERELRASWISIALTIAMAALLAIILVWQPPVWLLYSATAMVWLFALLYFLPLNKPAPAEVSLITERVDERDTLFAREEYRPGTERYDEYYDEHPQYKEVDDRLRGLPERLGPGGRYYNEEQAEHINAIFQSVHSLTTRVDGEVSATKTVKDAPTLTAEVKELAIQLGAAEVGIARLNSVHAYSHVGRGPEPWGTPINLDHKYAIAFTLEMGYDQVQAAPDLPITEDAALQYLKAATISVNMAQYIRNLGYSARAHISDSNYQVMLPPVAQDAGLGELSRMGYLISRKYGARVRLGAVTTDLPLVADRPKTFGGQEFCAVCRKCSSNCPTAAISFGEKRSVRGVQKWQLNAEQCLWFWRVAGTDCGLCMRVCPYSHPPTFVHNLVRRGIRRSAFARRVSILGDDFFYGRKARVKPPTSP